MRRSVRFSLCGFVVLLVIATVVVPSVGVAQETTATTTASTGGTDVGGVYGYTGVTGSGKKRGGTATIIDYGDYISISTTVRNVAAVGNVPVNVRGDKVVIEPGRVTVHISDDISIGSGVGELTFRKKGNRWAVRGAGQGEALGAKGTVTVTGFSHSGSWKPTDPPPEASPLVKIFNRVLSAVTPSKPQPSPDAIKMMATVFAIMFMMAMMAVETAVFGSAATGASASGVSGAPPGPGSAPPASPTQPVSPSPAQAAQPEEGSPAGSPD